ncbi:hypothetical protein EXIGLDRAFT_718219 [Exidia glandulosa HHB12029]|uniref:Uncharacterized protein n=1 Tax=Exidia glandulosa HHB12029 TaxID=1314781 RepID=A0A166AJP6_EXIGL|nr:hypothetical protein EXIGLDRAFT_718219 [Exidia glandulosa HHB12029]
MFKKPLLSILALVGLVKATLPAAGGPYIISSIAPGNVDSQFLTVANSQACKTPSTFKKGARLTILLTSQAPGTKWFLTKLGDDGSFGIYKFRSALGNQVNFAMGVQDVPPAVVGPGGSVFNVSTTSTGNGLFTSFLDARVNSGFVVSTIMMSQDISPGQQVVSFSLTPGNAAQEWNIRLPPN